MLYLVDWLPRKNLPGRRAMPLTYAIDALTDIMIRGRSLWDNSLPLAALFGFAIVMAALAALTMKREVA